jgi:xanthine/uracil/vitamin C permease (AzgA family)
MAYIVVVNPSILSTPGTGMAFSGVLTATVLVCFTPIKELRLAREAS